MNLVEYEQWAALYTLLSELNYGQKVTFMSKFSTTGAAYEKAMEIRQAALQSVTKDAD